MATRTIGKYAAILTANSDQFTGGMKRAAKATTDFQKQVTASDAVLGKHRSLWELNQERLRNSYLRRAEVARQRSMNQTLAEMAAYESKATAIIAQETQKRIHLHGRAAQAAAAETGVAAGGGAWGLLGRIGGQHAGGPGKRLQMMIGGGQLLAVGFAANAVRRLGDTVNAAALEYRAGTISAGEFVSQLGSGIPIAGALADGIGGIITAVTGWETVAARAARIKIFKEIRKDAKEAREAVEEALRVFNLTDEAKVDRKLYLDYQNDLKAIVKNEAQQLKTLGEQFGPRAARIHRQAIDDMAVREELYARESQQLREDRQQVFEAEWHAAEIVGLRAEIAVLEKLQEARSALMLSDRQRFTIGAQLVAKNQEMFDLMMNQYDANEMLAAGERLRGENAKAVASLAKAEEARITKAADKMKAEGERRLESWRTPMQVYEAEIQMLNDLVAVGIFNWEQYAEGVRRARAELETKARTEVRGPGLIVAGTQEAARVTGTYRERARREEELKKEVAKVEQRAKEQVRLLDDNNGLLRKIAEKLSVVEPI